MMKKSLEIKKAWKSMEVDAAKYGGDNAADIFENVNQIEQDVRGGKKKLITISAIRDSSEEEAGKFRHPSVQPNPERSNSYGFNTTDHLNAAADALREGDKDRAIEIVECIEIFTKDRVLRNLSQDPNVDLDDFEKIISKKTKKLIKVIKNFDIKKDRVLDLGRDQALLSDSKVHSIVGFGEGLARDLYSEYFAIRQSNAETPLKHKTIRSEDLLDTLDIDESKKELKIQHSSQKYRRNTEAQIINEVSQRVQNVIDEVDVVFAGGYSPVLAYNTGFSELVAAVIGGASAKEGLPTSFSVEKAVSLMSADPRILKKYGLEAKPLGDVNIGFALNLMDKSTANSGVIESDALRYSLGTGSTVFIKGKDGNMSRIHDFKAESGSIENLSLRKTTHLEINIGDFPLLDPRKIKGTVDLWVYRNELETILEHKAANVISMDFAGNIPKEAISKLEDRLKQEYDEALIPNFNQDHTALFCLGNNMDKTGVAESVTKTFRALGMSIPRSKQPDQQLMAYMVPREKEELALAAIHKICINLSDEELKHLEEEGTYIEDLVGPLMARHYELQQ